MYHVLIMIIAVWIVDCDSSFICECDFSFADWKLVIQDLVDSLPWNVACEPQLGLKC